jgi:general secretion pathway protein H
MRRPAGFTLVELIVVLAILAALAALAAPSFSRTIASARLRAGATEVRATLARARSLAVYGGRVRSVVFDLDGGGYGIDNEAALRTLPDPVRWGALRVVGDRKERGGARVLFFPDGSAEEAEVTVVLPDGGRIRVTVDPLTGIVEAGT